MELKKIKLDFEGLSQADLRNYQELFISTISKLKSGLFNYEASRGLHDCITLIGDLHHQTSNKIKDIQEKLEEFEITVDVQESEETKDED